MDALNADRNTARQEGKLTLQKIDSKIKVVSSVEIGGNMLRSEDYAELDNLLKKSKIEKNNLLKRTVENIADEFDNSIVEFWLTLQNINTVSTKTVKVAIFKSPNRLKTDCKQSLIKFLPGGLLKYALRIGKTLPEFSFMIVIVFN